MKRRFAIVCALLAALSACSSEPSGGTDSSSEAASSSIPASGAPSGVSSDNADNSTDNAASSNEGSDQGSNSTECRPGSTSGNGDGEDTSCSVPSTSETDTLPDDLTAQKIGWLTYGMPKGWTPMPGVEASTVANAWVGSDSSDYLTVLRGASTMGNTDYGQAVEGVQRWQKNHLVSGDELFERTFTTADELLRIHETQLRAANSYVEYDWVIEQISTGEIAHVTLALTQANEDLIDHVRQSLQHVK